MQFFNIVLRSAMEKLQLEMIKRNYYDPKAAVHLPQHKLELWPGYITSIRQHESQVLLCCEISLKILRTDTGMHFDIFLLRQILLKPYV